MKAKRLLSLVLATMLLASLSVTAFADDTTKTLNSSTTSGDVTITTEAISAAYTVTIPASLTLSAKDGGVANSGDVVLSNARLQSGYGITVSFPASVTLTNSNDSAKTLTASASGTKGSYSDVTTGDNIVITFKNEGGQFSDTATASFSVSQTAWEAAYVGTYSGTETFTISYDAVTSA